MALKDIKSVLSKKKGASGGLGNTSPLMPSPATSPMMDGAQIPPMDMGTAPVPPMDMGGSSTPTPPPDGEVGAQDPQAMMEEGKQKVLEGLAEIKEAQAQMGGGQVNG